jgi:hypothetical protein
LSVTPLLFKIHSFEAVRHTCPYVLT